MRTPIVDFLRAYRAENRARFHMPGHKGAGFLGCESWDITEVDGADALYEASGIIAESEANAAALFGARRSCYSTEGSSQCIRAMLYLALMNRPAGRAPVVLAARNVHKAFVYAAALLDFEIEWLWPQESASLCACRITPQMLEAALDALPEPPVAVYITSPDYLGGLADIRGMAEVCRRHDTILAVDNAHGAYLHFLPEPLHPLDLGAAICCDSAHKTLPVLTGGAYLHIGDGMTDDCAAQAKQALALFGSTSPSYLTLASLDNCNRYLAEGYRQALAKCAGRISALKARLRDRGWQLEASDPLRLTLRAPQGMRGDELARRLRGAGIECEYADDMYLVLMITPENPDADLERFEAALGANCAPYAEAEALPLPKAAREMRVREALFRPHETIPTFQALGRICAAPTVSCPPAIPIAVSGERIGAEAIALFRRYGVGSVDVLK